MTTVASLIHLDSSAAKNNEILTLQNDIGVKSRTPGGLDPAVRGKVPHPPKTRFERDSIFGSTYGTCESTVPHMKIILSHL